MKAWKLVGGVAVGSIAAFALIALAWVNTPFHKGEMLFGSTVSGTTRAWPLDRRGADVDFYCAQHPPWRRNRDQDAKAVAILWLWGRVVIFRPLRASAIAGTVSRGAF